MDKKRINLDKLSTNDICSLGLKIKQNFSDDLNYVRTVVCENSYIEIKSEKGKEIISELKKDFNF